jgi:acetolactate synthase small subunit
MQTFHIRYRNTQGSLMRILNAVSRRGLDFPSVLAAPAGTEHVATLTLEVNAKQVGQLYREWYAITDVLDVRSNASVQESDGAWATPYPPASEGLGERARAALA